MTQDGFNWQQSRWGVSAIWPMCSWSEYYSPLAQRALLALDGVQWTKVGAVPLESRPDLMFAAVVADSNRDPQLSTTLLDNVTLGRP